MTVSRATGKNVLQQLREIHDLRRRAILFGISDYFDHRLFEEEIDRTGNAVNIAGWRSHRWLDETLNPQYWCGLVRDKLNFFANMRALEIPVPRLLAIYQPDGRVFGATPNYCVTEALSGFLRTSSAYPIFAKPIQGGVGFGAWALRSFEEKTNEITFGDGTRVSLDQFLAELDKRRPMMPPRSGYLFEECLKQHHELNLICGEATSSVRLIVLITDTGPVAHQAIWRIVSGDNMTDNFNHGRSGNLIGGLDIESGQLTRVIKGYGLHREIVLEHPNTGQSFSKFRLPQWDTAVSLVLKGALAFPMLRFQHWDIAFTENGPVILEMNTNGSIDMIQFANGTGLLDQRLRDTISSAQKENWGPR